MIEAKDLEDEVQDLLIKAVGSVKRTKSKDDEKLKLFLDVYYDLNRFIMHFINDRRFKEMKKFSKNNEYDLTRMYRLFDGASIEDEMPKTNIINFKGYINSENTLLIDKYEKIIQLRNFMKKWVAEFEKQVGKLREELELREALYQQDMKLIIESWRKYNKKTLLESRRKQ